MSQRDLEDELERRALADANPADPDPDDPDDDDDDDGELEKTWPS